MFKVFVLLMSDTTGIAVWAQISTSFKHIFSKINLRNLHFNMYTVTSTRQKDSSGKNSHTKCFKTTQFDRFHCRKFIAICSSLFISYKDITEQGIVIVCMSERENECRVFLLIFYKTSCFIRFYGSGPIKQRINLVTSL